LEFGWGIYDCWLRNPESNPELAVGYVASRWFLGASIIGATSMAQLKEDIAAAQFTLDAETLEDIRPGRQAAPRPSHLTDGEPHDWLVCVREGRSGVACHRRRCVLPDPDRRVAASPASASAISASEPLGR
jgi:hypothetical protein